MLAPLRGRFSIATFALGNPFSVGAMIRVGHNFLMKELLLIGDEPHYEKASMGMQKYETIRRFRSEAEFLDAVGSRPLWALERERATRSIYDVHAYPDDVVFLFGSERYGINESLLSRADEVLAIPIYGVNHSLPVAVAAGIVMHDWARIRYARGPCT